MVFHKTHGMNQPLFSMRTLYVSRTPADSSVYPTISAALDAIPMDLNEPACIYLAPGIYHEKITINKPYLTILGTGKSNKDVVLTYDDYALAPMADIGKLGTFRSYSVFIDTHDVTLQNLTIENASGDSLTHGQAIALYADGDRLVIDSCRLIGHQDRFRQKRSSLTVLSVQNNLPQGSTADNIIRTVISVATLILFLEVPLLILKIVNYMHLTAMKK